MSHLPELLDYLGLKRYSAANQPRQPSAYMSQVSRNYTRRETHVDTLLKEHVRVDVSSFA